MFKPAIKKSINHYEYGSGMWSTTVCSRKYKYFPRVYGMDTFQFNTGTFNIDYPHMYFIVINKIKNV